MVYVDSDGDCDNLAAALAEALLGTLPRPQVVSLPETQLYVARNDDFDPVDRAEFPGGFKFFRCVIEVTSGEAPTSLDAQVQAVSALLEYCWAKGMPAVAACEYEDRLPHGGGYNSSAVPWPKKP